MMNLWRSPSKDLCILPMFIKQPTNNPMPLTETFFITGLFILQVVLIFLFFHWRSFEVVHKKLSRKVLVYFTVQLLCLVLILLGGYLEKEQTLYSDIRRPFDEYKHSPPEIIEIEGDPDLLRWLKSQKPDLPRPNFANVREFRAWQTSLRRNLYTIFDIADIYSSIDVQYRKISSTIVTQNITRDFLTFNAFDGTTIPAYLFTPQSNNSPQPAIIVLSGHVGEYEEGISQTAGLVDSYQHKAALELARAGFVTLTIEFRGFGYLGPHVNTNHKLVAYNAILGGSFYKAIISKDIKYAFDLLQSLNGVDSKRIGITGASFGGEMAVVYAALDERIKASVFNSSGGATGVRHGVSGKRRAQPFYTHIIPGRNTYLLQEDLYFLIAPRPLLGVVGGDDYSGDSEVFSKTVREAYKTFSASSLFGFEIAPGGHEYFIQPSVQFFTQYL